MLQVSRKYMTKIVYVVFLALAIIVIDTSFSRISDLSFDLLYSNLWVVAYVIILILAISSQYTLLSYARSKSKHIGIEKDRGFHLLGKFVLISQTLLSGIALYIISQMLLFSYYNTSLLILYVTLAYTISIFTISLLTWRFFYWVKTHRSYILILFGLSSGALVINCLSTLILTDQVLLVKPENIRQHVQISFYIRPNSILSNFSLAFTISSIISFLLTWIATALMLRYYSRILGKMRYWFILSIPLLYFLIQFSGIAGLRLNTDPVLLGTILTLLFSFSKVAGGILFGIAFWLIIKKLDRKNLIRDYMILASYGVMLTFISNQGIILSSAFYPPFGLATVSFLTVSSYIMLAGIYASAISVAQNSAIRHSMKEMAFNQFKLLSVMGFAEMSREIEKKVFEMVNAKREILDQADVKTYLEEKEIKDYLETVMDEIKKQKPKSETT
jgi:hypothetical protein